jgi:hypothetical protein
MRTALVSGALANKPGNGGNAWSRLNWVLGLARLGFRVVFLELIESSVCVGPDGRPAGFMESENVRFFRDVTEQFGLEKSAALLCDGGAEGFGLTVEELVALAGQSELLINFGGHLSLEPVKSLPRCKVFFDDDPGYTQFWAEAGVARERLKGHDHYFTVGGSIGAPECHVPTNGVRWRPIRPPVALAEWPVGSEAYPDRFTTVASWRGGYGRLEAGGTTYGQKAHEFRKFAELPRRSRASFEVALDIDPGDAKDAELLCGNGWALVDPRAVAGDPHRYRKYIESSGGEFSAAQGVYVQTRCGWLSDRTACYLASGKPALVQDTGVNGGLPVGEGLVVFATLEEAAQGAARIARDYAHHARAARALAERYFDSDKVLGDLLDQVGVGCG